MLQLSIFQMDFLQTVYPFYEFVHYYVLQKRMIVRSLTIVIHPDPQKKRPLIS